MKYILPSLLFAFMLVFYMAPAQAEGCCGNKLKLEVCPAGPNGPQGPQGPQGPKGPDGSCPALNVQCPTGFYIASIVAGQPQCEPITGHTYCEAGGNDTTERQIVQCLAGQTVFERHYDCAAQSWSAWQITQNDCQ